MVKKISYLVFAAAIMIAGYFAFNRLHYWERSTGIFCFKSSDQPFHGRMGRDQDQFNAGRMNRHGGNDLTGGKKISLKHTFWFLAVFASFAILAIYIDKGIGCIRYRR